MSKIYVFKRLKNENGVGDMLMFKEGMQAEFDSVVEAVKYLFKLNISEEDIMNMIFSDSTGFIRYPCNMWTLMGAKGLIG